MKAAEHALNSRYNSCIMHAADHAISAADNKPQIDQFIYLRFLSEWIANRPGSPFRRASTKEFTQAA
jgi:hypothetical protein